MLAACEFALSSAAFDFGERTPRMVGRSSNRWLYSGLPCSLAHFYFSRLSDQPGRPIWSRLLFIDELDAVCPPRGAYADAISQEFTAQLLQEVDGLLSDSQAVFLVAATKPPPPGRLDLTNFSERKPTITARSTMRFTRRI